MNSSPKPRAMASACTTSASASARRPAPSARAIAAEIPPPMAPADIICINMNAGKTRATPASASVPSLPTKYVSMRPTEACMSMTSTFGVASRRSVLVIGPSSRTRVRGSNRDAVAAGGASWGRDPTSVRTPLPSDITASVLRTWASMDCSFLPGERLSVSQNLHCRVRGCGWLRRCGRLMNRQARGDRPMDRCRDAELQASPNDSSAQCLDLEPTAVCEVSGHRRSPLRGQRRGLLDDAIHGVRRKQNPFPPRNGRDLLACGGEEQVALGAREERTDARARECRHATDAGDEQELLPQHAIDVGRDLVRNAALFQCVGDSLNAFGHGA